MNTRAKINEVIHKSLGLEGVRQALAAADLKPEHRLVDDLGADSLDIVELTMAIEDEFDLYIPDEDAEKWVTIGDVYEYIEDRV